MGVALDVPRGDDSSDYIDLALCWPEPRGRGRRRSEGTVKARPHSF